MSDRELRTHQSKKKETENNVNIKEKLYGNPE
jgi:hypothetical protein